MIIIKGEEKEGGENERLVTINVVKKIKFKDESDPKYLDPVSLSSGAKQYILNVLINNVLINKHTCITIKAELGKNSVVFTTQTEVNLNSISPTIKQTPVNVQHFLVSFQ